VEGGSGIAWCEDRSATEKIVTFPTMDEIPLRAVDRAMPAIQAVPIDTQNILNRDIAGLALGNLHPALPHGTRQGVGFLGRDVVHDLIGLAVLPASEQVDEGLARVTTQEPQGEHVHDIGRRVDTWQGFPIAFATPERW